MELSDLIGILFRRKWIIVLTVIVTVAVAVIGSFLVTPIYTATAKIRVATAPNPLVDRVDAAQAERLLNTYTLIASTNPLLESVITELNLDTTARYLREKVRVQLIEDTELIYIYATDTDPDTAASIATAVANALINNGTQDAGLQTASDTILEQVNQAREELAELRAEYDRLLLEEPDQFALITETGRSATVKQQIFENLQTQYDETRLREALNQNSITLIEAAEPPNIPTSPRKTLNVALGGLLGLIGGVGLSLIVENMDKRVYDLNRIQNVVKLPTLGSIPNGGQNRSNGPLNQNTLQREAYRRLRTNIFALADDTKPLKTIMITSADENEGKSTIVANLSASIAQLGRTVLVIDCDLRKPSQHILFGMPNEIGLSSVLKKQTPVWEAIQRTELPGLHLLTSGPLPHNPTELLSAPYMWEVLRDLSLKYDMILLDTPAVIPVVDAATIAPLTDGVLQVVRSGISSEDTTLATFDQILEVRGKPIGLVLNDAPKISSTYYTIPVPPKPGQRPA